MDIKFNLEKELVSFFVKNYSLKSHEILLQEMPIRFGNIDVFSIKNTEVPFSEKQIRLLAKPACSLIFTKIKNKRPVSKANLFKTVGLSESTINGVLYELINNNLIIKKEENYYRETNFVFPKTIVTGYEAKLKNFNKALYQAVINKEFVDYSYVVFPYETAQNILNHKKVLLKTNNIGIIGVDNHKNHILLKAYKTETINDYIRLLSIAKANVMQLESC